jgi:hypothetical protein
MANRAGLITVSNIKCLSVFVALEGCTFKPCCQQTSVYGVNASPAGEPDMLMTLLLLGTLQVTSYRSVVHQTDMSPYITSTGERVHKYGVAVSQDLLCPKAFGKTKLHKRRKCPYINGLHYGDWLYVDGHGLRVINDTMNPRHRNHIDLWVSSHKEEKAFGTRQLKVYVMEGLN